jgi:hypothetical protein
MVARYATSLTGPVGQSRTVEAVDHREAARSRCSFVVKPRFIFLASCAYTTITVLRSQQPD